MAYVSALAADAIAAAAAPATTHFNIADLLPALAIA
jgi:hypothetical protein